jgi:hypothetical protein
MSRKNARRVSLLLVLMGGIFLAFAEDVPSLPRDPAVATARLCSYSVQAGLDGEIYPVFANYASLQRQNERSFGAVAVTIINPTLETVRQRVSVQVPGWSDREIQFVEVEPHRRRTLMFAPSFLPRFYENREIVAATAEVSVSDTRGGSLYESTVPVRLRSGEDMYWGPDFKYASFIASWVTPHDSQVEAILARAKRYTADRRLPGYEEWKNAQEQESETYREAQAIFTALQRTGFSYVKSSSTLGDHQSLSERVRMPHASLSNSSANCIDAAVAYASLFENLGMDTELILVPGHAYVGVRLAKGSKKFLVIDAALTGRATFAAAVASAARGLARQRASIKPVLIEDARSSGIYPMPR